MNWAMLRLRILLLSLDCSAQVEQNFMGVQGGYVTYRVNTQTSMPSYPRSGSAVRRRFRDFVVRHLSCLKPCQKLPSHHPMYTAMP